MNRATVIELHDILWEALKGRKLPNERTAEITVTITRGQYDRAKSLLQEIGGKYRRGWREAAK